MRAVSKIALLLGSGKMKPKAEEDDLGGEEPEGGEDDMDESAKASAARRVLKAVKSDDAAALAKALSSFYRLC